ncbi:hypothetical protein [Kutzneria sp. NPDC052558]|uniref:hypothetical protein n=1 Tax=Kutzneria sp. NPDC052558 TaxID=3364121 RepID=UPI0037C72D21
MGGRQFDGKYTANGKEIWYEAKSGNYWQLVTNNPDKWQDFTSTMGRLKRITDSNGKDFMLYSENQIPDQVTDWLKKKGIPYEVR